MVRTSSDAAKPFNLAALADAKKLPVDFLIRLGLHDSERGVGIPYYDTAGNCIATKLRTALKAADGSRWATGIPPAAYGSWRLDHARKVGQLVLVEGESDTLTLWFHDVPALGIPGCGAANSLLAEHLEQIDRLYVVREPDRGGHAFIDNMAMRLSVLDYRGQACEVVMSGAKDASALHIISPEDFEFNFALLLQSAGRLPVPSKTWSADEQTRFLRTIAARPEIAAAIVKAGGFARG